MKILAIMQNQWFQDPARIQRMLDKWKASETEEDYYKLRERLIARCLFAGCRSGQVLKQTLGDLVDYIVWDEASPEIGDKSSSSFGFDSEHMHNTIERVRPDVIITYGKVAADGLTDSLRRFESTVVFKHIEAPHPTSRGSDKMTKLHRVRELINELR